MSNDYLHTRRAGHFGTESADGGYGEGGSWEPLMAKISDLGWDRRVGHSRKTVSRPMIVNRLKGA